MRREQHPIAGQDRLERVEQTVGERDVGLGLASQEMMEGGQ